MTDNKEFGCDDDDDVAAALTSLFEFDTGSP